MPSVFERLPGLCVECEGEVQLTGGYIAAHRSGEPGRYSVGFLLGWAQLCRRHGGVHLYSCRAAGQPEDE